MNLKCTLWMIMFVTYFVLLKWRYRNGLFGHKNTDFFHRAIIIILKYANWSRFAWKKRNPLNRTLEIFFLNLFFWIEPSNTKRGLLLFVLNFYWQWILENHCKVYVTVISLVSSNFVVSINLVCSNIPFINS